MLESNTLRAPSLAPIGYTALGLFVLLLGRSYFMPQWSPVEEPPRELSFLILWMMAVLPVLYLAFRRWAQGTLESFMPQVFVFWAISFGIQTSLNAVSTAFGLLELPTGIAIQLVWALPWLAMTTVFKNSYVTKKQCKQLLLVLAPSVLFLHVVYLYAPALAFVYMGIYGSVAALVLVVAMVYGLFAWRLRQAR